jgi:hypothetical protein
MVKLLDDEGGSLLAKNLPQTTPLTDAARCGHASTAARSGCAQTADTYRAPNSCHHANTAGIAVPTSPPPSCSSPCPAPRAKAARMRAANSASSPVLNASSIRTRCPRGVSAGTRKTGVRPSRPSNFSIRVVMGEIQHYGRLSRRPSQPDVVIDGDFDLLPGAEITFGGLDRGVASRSLICSRPPPVLQATDQHSTP